jgi:hypothetical protein
VLIVLRALAMALLGACAAAPHDSIEHRTGSHGERIVDGTLDATTDAVVLASRVLQCTGTLVTPKMVLTDLNPHGRATAPRRASACST